MGDEGAYEHGTHGAARRKMSILNYPRVEWIQMRTELQTLPGRAGEFDYLRDHMEVRIALLILVAKVVNGMTSIIN